jgi:hypothetical protein
VQPSYYIVLLRSRPFLSAHLKLKLPLTYPPPAQDNIRDIKIIQAGDEYVYMNKKYDGNSVKKYIEIGANINN